MELITFLLDKISALVPFIILLGLLIFVHELGHFLVAKFFGVRVETFSLGFGKKIFSYKKGDTTYALSLIPLGGYVKMFGDDPSATVASDQKKFSFLHKPVGQRIWIVLAGPLMNLFFAIVLFIAISYIGTPVQAPILGEIEPGTPAFEAGFRTGDEIVKVNGNSQSYWHKISDIIQNSAGEELHFVVKREGTQETAEVKATPKYAPNEDALSLKGEVGAIPGLSLHSKAPVIGVSSAKSPAAQAGLKPLDVIEKINGEEVLYGRQILPLIKKHAVSGKLELTVSAFTGEPETSSPRTVIIAGWKPPKDDSKILSSLGIDSPELYVLDSRKDSPAKKAGLARGDKIIAINGRPVDSWEQVIAEVSSYKQGDAPIAFTVSRMGEIIKMEIHPEMTELMNAKLQDEQRFTVGIRSGVASATSKPITEKYTNIGDALSYGIEKTVFWTKLTVVSLVKLVMGDVSPRNIAGIVTIGRVANQSYEVGLFAFLRVMAIISINLFLLNLLPIPILDGGHLLFFSLEALRGAPVSLRKMEIAQQVGLIIMMTLMVFALFNDIRNWLSSTW